MSQEANEKSAATAITVIKRILRIIYDLIYSSLGCPLGKTYLQWDKKPLQISCIFFYLDVSIGNNVTDTSPVEALNSLQSPILFLSRMMGL